MHILYIYRYYSYVFLLEQPRHRSGPPPRWYACRSRRPPVRRRRHHRSWGCRASSEYQPAKAATAVAAPLHAAWTLVNPSPDRQPLLPQIVAGSNCFGLRFRSRWHQLLVRELPGMRTAIEGTFELPALLLFLSVSDYLSLSLSFSVSLSLYVFLTNTASSKLACFLSRKQQQAQACFSFLSFPSSLCFMAFKGNRTVPRSTVFSAISQAKLPATIVFSLWPIGPSLLPLFCQKWLNIGLVLEE